MDLDPRLNHSGMDLYGSYGQKQMMRKINKPLVEKKRRARINTSLQQLKSLVVTALSKTNSKAKLEKADILEMTVKYIRNLQRQQYAHTAAADPDLVNKYRAGFMACVKEVSCFLTTLENLDLDTKARVLDHLATALSASASPQAKSSIITDMQSSSSDSDDSPVKFAPVARTSDSPAARKQLYCQTDGQDLVSYALMDSGLGAELDSSILDEDDELAHDEENETQDMTSACSIVTSSLHEENEQRVSPLSSSEYYSDAYSRPPLQSFGPIDANNNTNMIDQNNNFSLPPIAQVFNRECVDMAGRANTSSLKVPHVTSVPNVSNVSHVTMTQNVPSNQNASSVYNENVPQIRPELLKMHPSSSKSFPPNFNRQMTENQVLSGEKPRNPQVLRVRSGNIQPPKFGKMYNALTKSVYQKPYSKPGQVVREELYIPQNQNVLRQGQNCLPRQVEKVRRPEIHQQLNVPQNHAAGVRPWRPW